MCAWITLEEMGKRDDVRGRKTREFDSARLAALTKEKLSDAEAQQIAVPIETLVAAEETEASISVGRARTLDDPMTTGLLAEVARRSQTTEFDDDLIKEVISKIDSGETTHPHTRRRAK
jgi:hypothetical protein